MHCGYVVKVKDLRPHTNADRLQIATFFHNDTCVNLDVKEGDIGIYFPSDLQLSLEYCIENHLLRKLPDGTPDTGYMEVRTRCVKVIKLRGEKSDGIFMPLSSLEAFGDISTLSIGDQITVFNGHEICKKYIPPVKHSHSSALKGNKKKINFAPLFAEHADTEQLTYNLGDFKPRDQVEITLKLHGTSQRTGYLPVLKKHKRTLLDKLFRREGTPIYEWDYVSGTRRTILRDYEGGYYGSDLFRETHAKIFEGKLHKGETVYYEVVGYTDTGVPIMPSANNKKLNDKNFVKMYGDTTDFSYGCSPSGMKLSDLNCDWAQDLKPLSDCYVYRMTMTIEDGVVIEYNPDFMRYRCEQIGVKTVPVMWSGIIENTSNDENTNFNAGEWIRNKAEEYYDGPDPIGKTHIREGVVVRIVNRPKFCAYKHKNFEFKVLENIIKLNAEAPDMEEADGLETKEMDTN